MKWLRQRCPVCSGNLYYSIEDVGWVCCFACARSYSAQALGVQPPAPIVVIEPCVPDTDRRCLSCHELRLIERYAYVNWKHHEQGRRETCMRCERKPRARGQAVA